MTLKQLQTFYWACRLGSFAAAAAHLCTTQSAVSVRIHDLERSLGVLLFDRSQRSARLTAKGRDLVKHAEELIARATEIQHRIGDVRVLSGTVRLGVTELVAVTWLPRLVGEINTHYPDVLVELDVDLTLNQLDKLQSGALDLVIVPGPIQQPGLTNIALGSVEFAWMASPDLGVPQGEAPASELHRWPLLSLSRASNLHALLGVWFDRNAARFRRIDVCNSIGVIAALTKAGLGVSFLPKDQFAVDIAAKRLQVLAIAPTIPALTYYAVYETRQTQPLSQSIADLAQRYSTFDKDVPDSSGPPAHHAARAAVKRASRAKVRSLRT